MKPLNLPLPAWLQRPVIAALLTLAALSGCMVGPDYRRPGAPVPDAYKEASGNNAGSLPDTAGAADARPATDAEAPIWQPARPADMEPRGEWWTVFDSAELNELAQRLNQNNYTIAEYEATYRQAQALVQQAQSGLYPLLGVSAAGSRSRAATSSGATAVAKSLSVGLDASWEPDLWGSVRRTIESDQARAEASAAQLAAMRLSLQAQLATAYLQLVVADAQMAQLRQITSGLTDLLRLTENQYRAGTVASDTVASAQSQLATQQATLTAQALSRAQLEHAIAVLIGVPPAQFSLPDTHPPVALPQVPAGLPSTLLQRRPDVAAAERTVAAANAQIGVAEAAYFPDITLSASGGFAGSALSGLLSTPHRVWSLGLALAGTLFDGGERSAVVAQARASYDASVASYRQTVLSAFQGVEDQLVAQRLLADEAAQSSVALSAARKAEQVTTNQYRAGTTTYLAVITVQNTRLTAENTLWTVRSNQYTTAVSLINNLGGNWDTGE